MPRLANHSVKCEGCDELVEPEDASKRVQYGLIGLLLLAIPGLFIGSMIGLATAGAGAAATIPLGFISAYAGWKIGTGWRQFRDGVNCPECGYVFGGYGNLSLPGGGELSLPSLRDRSSSATTGDESENPEPAFHIGFACSNCGSEWTHGFQAGKRVDDAAEIGEDTGVVVTDDEGSKRLACPTCEATKSVEVANRGQTEGPNSPESGSKRPVLVRALDVAVYVGLTMVFALAVGFTVESQFGGLYAVGSFIVAFMSSIVYWSLSGIQIVD